MNTWKYKVYVTGKRNACLAFYGAAPFSLSKEITEYEGTDDSFILKFEALIFGQPNMDERKYEGSKVELPEDDDEAIAKGREFGNEFNLNMLECSKAFEVEYWCTSVDTDDPFEGEEFPNEYAEHGCNGEEAEDEDDDEIYNEITLIEWDFSGDKPAIIIG